MTKQRLPTFPTSIPEELSPGVYLHAKFLHNGVSVSYDLLSRVHCVFNLEVTSFLHFMATCSLSAVYLGRERTAVNDKQQIPPTRPTSSVLHI